MSGAIPTAPHATFSSANRTVLVVGSYPPVPTAGAVVALETVRRLWAEGAEPCVVAPRASAAPMTVPVRGLLAGRRLRNLRTLTEAVDIVLCAERDLPIPTSGGPRPLLSLLQRLTAEQVVRSLAAFDHVTLISCGDTGIPASVWARLVFAADTVVDRSDLRGAAGVTTLGPSEGGPTDVARNAWSRLAPRVLGRHTPRVRRLLSRSRQLARSVGRRQPKAV